MNYPTETTPRRKFRSKLQALLASTHRERTATTTSDVLIASRRAWLRPIAAGAASLALLPARSRAAPPGIINDFGVSIDNFGAKGDGQADDAPAFQRAVDSLGTAGGRILLGAKHYRLASPISITRAYVMFQGQGYAEAPGPSGGTWLLIITSGFQPFTITNTHGNETRGTSFKDLAVWQQQPPSKPGWAAIDYPFVFTLDKLAGGAEFDNIYLCNVTRGISAYFSGRLNIGYLKGQCYDTMVYIDGAQDVCHIDFIESWFFVTADQNMADYMMENFDTLRLGRVDGLILNQIFVFCSRAGIHCVQTKLGNAKIVVGGLYADHSRYALWFDHCIFQTNETDVSAINQVGSNHVRFDRKGGGAAIVGGAMVKIENCQRTKLQMTNVNAGFLDSSALQVSGSDNQVSIGQAWFQQFNMGRHTPAAPAIMLEDSAGSPPNIVETSQPIRIANSSGGGVIMAAGNSQFHDPDSRTRKLLIAEGLLRPAAVK